FRSNSRYDDRPMEVPERVLRAFRQASARTNGATLDGLADLAAALTDPQTRGMQDYWGWYLEGSGLEGAMTGARVYDNRHHLRFWARLLPVLRQAALAGQVVPVEKMGTLQRDAFVTALTA